LYKRDDDARQILIPYDPELDDIANRLWEIDGRNLKKLKATKLCEADDDKLPKPEPRSLIQKPSIERYIARKIVYDHSLLMDPYHHVE